MSPISSSTGKRPSESLENAVLLEWLRQMQLIREFETRTMQSYQQAKIGGFCHIYSGQEACAVGTIGSVKHDDPVITAYRDHGHALARGMSPRSCMAEMYGKAAGCAKGKGGSMHMFDRPNHLYGGHGIVGAQTPLGAGFAFAAKYELEVLGKSLDGSAAKKKVCLCYLGDGALNQGALHEAMNLAGLYGLPVVYIVENNGYSMGTSIERGTTEANNLGAKAAAYGIDFLKVDGMDIRNIYDHFHPFTEYCRENQRPGFVDLKTYRYQGHSMSDPQKYRTKDEIDQFKGKDSIASLASHLMANKADGGRMCLTEDEWKHMQREIRELVFDAVEFAENAPDPDVDRELFSDVLANPVRNMSPSAEYTRGDQNPLL